MRVSAAEEIQHTAEALYYGGWRAADRERLLQTKSFGLSENEADAICDYLIDLDNQYRKDSLWLRRIRQQEIKNGYQGKRNRH